MARTLDPAAHALKRDTFVDAAARLIQAKGYEQMSLQDVLDELDASKGAFYHYFDSRVALLEAVVERMVDAATAAVEPLVADPDAPALRKLADLFTGIASWKEQRQELLIEMMRVWLSDENALVREKLRRRTVIRLTPLLAAILRQGQAEGVFSTGSAEHAAGVLVSLVLGLNETAGRLYVARLAGEISFGDVERTIAAYGDAFERILGLPPGSWPAADPTTIRKWFA
jgi:AcrR family transcriptional regulator